MTVCPRDSCVSCFAQYLLLWYRGIVLGKIDVEMPAHQVLKKTPLYEIRTYPGATMACVYSDEFENEKGNQFRDSAFRTLAGYIGVLRTAENEGQVDSERS